MPIEQFVVHSRQCVHFPVLLTLKTDKAAGNFRNAPQGQTNRQKPFLPSKYTIRIPSIINVNNDINTPGRNCHILGYDKSILSAHLSEELNKEKILGNR